MKLGCLNQGTRTFSLIQVVYFCCSLILKTFHVEALCGLQPYGLTATGSSTPGNFLQAICERPNLGIPWAERISPVFCCLDCKNSRIKVFLMLSFFSCCHGKTPERMGRVVPNHWNINFSLGLIKRCVHVLSLTLALGVLRNAAHSCQLFTGISAHQE